MNEKKFLRSPKTNLVIERLQLLQQGVVVPWEELSALLEMDAQKEGRCYVESAKRILLNQNHLVFDVVDGLGVRRETAEQIVNYKGGDWTRRRIHKQARKCLKKQECVDSAQLNATDRAEHQGTLVNAAILAQCTSTTSYEQQKVSINTGNYPPELDLKLFGKAAS